MSDSTAEAVNVAIPPLRQFKVIRTDGKVVKLEAHVVQWLDDGKVLLFFRHQMDINAGPVTRIHRILNGYDDFEDVSPVEASDPQSLIVH
jgi:hypothetical protein